LAPVVDIERDLRRVAEMVRRPSTPFVHIMHPRDYDVLRRLMGADPLPKIATDIWCPRGVRYIINPDEWEWT
jgi:hypothetical protein